MSFFQQKSPKESAMPPDAFSNEDEIEILEQRLRLLRDRKVARPEASAPVADADREAGREAAEQAHAAEGPAMAIPPPAPAPQSASPADEHYHEAKVGELKTYEAEKQPKALVEIAFERNLHDAVDIARRLDDAYLLDEFHDILSDDEKLHKRLVEAGKFKES